jgi:hypothetical protein
MLTIRAKTTTDVERQHDAISYLDRIYCYTHLDHNTKVFVAEYFPYLYVGTALTHTQIGATDIASRQLNDNTLHERFKAQSKSGDFLCEHFLLLVSDVSDCRGSTDQPDFRRTGFLPSIHEELTVTMSLANLSE